MVSPLGPVTSKAKGLGHISSSKHDLPCCCAGLKYNKRIVGYLINNLVLIVQYAHTIAYRIHHWRKQTFGVFSPSVSYISHSRTMKESQQGVHVQFKFEFCVLQPEQGEYCLLQVALPSSYDQQPRAIKTPCSGCF